MTIRKVTKPEELITLFDDRGSVEDVIYLLNENLETNNLKPVSIWCADMLHELILGAVMGAKDSDRSSVAICLMTAAAKRIGDLKLAKKALH